MNLRTTIPRKFRRGLTLMEAVVAIGVVAVAVPLILAATSVSAKTRMAAENETRASWIAQQVFRQLTESWQNLKSPAFPIKPNFPTFQSATAPMILLYNSDGALLGQGTALDFEKGSSNPQSVYLVSVYGIGQKASNLQSGDENLSRVTISVENSARAPKAKRSASYFTLLIPRQTAS